jgi:trehalose 6-phosphate synthase
MHLSAIGARHGVIVVSNRQPYQHEVDRDGRTVVVHSASGVVNAVEPLVRACSGVWVAHGAGPADRSAVDARDGLAVPPESPSYRLRRVWLNEVEEQGYYDGFANEALWPLCHRAHVRPIFRATDFDAYWIVNGRFADAVCSEATSDVPVVLVQDYHFALTPQIIRERLPRATIAAFWHIPWPHWQVFEICPWRRYLLEGLLGSSVVGFQTPIDVRNFIEAVERTLEVHVDREQNEVTFEGRRVQVRAYPVSIAWPGRAASRLSPEICRASVRRQLDLPADVRLGVGVDRLDYTKGLEEKCAAVERLLEWCPELTERFVFVQLAEPSRERLAAYRELRSRVRAAADRINTRFGRGTYRPFVLLEGHHTAEEVQRFLLAADLCYVGSLHDGMNLVSKEFVAARHDERGVLVLSTFAGAARELTDALIVNPYDEDQVARALIDALNMDARDQRARMRRMRAHVAEFGAERWAERILADALGSIETPFLAEMRRPAVRMPDVLIDPTNARGTEALPQRGRPLSVPLRRDRRWFARP